MADDARLQIVLEAKIDKLTQKLGEANSAVSRSSKKIQADLDDANHKWERMFLGEGPGKAIERVFSRSRLAVLEEGSTKIPLFGSALEALGPAGIAAAGGIAAVGVALEQAHKAMEWADEIDRFSKSVGVSTTFLQEFDYANISLSVGVGKGREALSGFNEVIGKYSAGLAPGKVAKYFDALGFTPEGARNTADTGKLLEQALLSLSKIPNASQRAGIAAATGLSAFLPVLADGKKGVEEFIAKMREASTSDGVISQAQIERAAQLNDDVERLQSLIGTHLKQAFIELAPAIDDAVSLAEKLIRKLAEIPAVMKGVDRILHPGRDQLIDYKPQANPIDNIAAVGRAHTVEDAANAALSGDYATLSDITGKRFGAGSARGSDYTPPKKAAVAKAAPRDDTDQQVKKAAEELASQSKALADSQAALTADIDARAAFERQAVAAELDKANARIDAEENLIDADKGLTEVKKGALLLQLASARQLAEQVAAAKVQKVNNDAETAVDARALEQRRLIVGYYDTIRSNTAALARTSAERRDAELRILAHVKSEADNAAVVQRDKDLRAAGTDQQRYRVQNDYEAAQGSAADAYASNIKKIIHDNQSALDTWREDVLKDAGEVQDALEKAAVKGFEAFNDGVANAITQGQSLGDVMHSVFASMEADLIKYLLKQAEIGVLGSGGAGGLFSGFTGLFGGGGLDLDALASSLPAFASGGPVTGPGGPTSDSILAKLSPGEFVLSNDMLKGLSSVPRGAGSPPTVISFDLRGAVMTADLLDQMQRIGNAAQVGGTVNGAAIGSANAQQRLAKSGARQLGR